MKVFITGASGFVGKRLVGELTRRGHAVTACVRDTSKADGLGAVNVSIIKEIGPDTDWGDTLSGHDAVIHLAARVHIMDDHDRDPLAAFRRVNVDGLRGLLLAAIDAGVGRVIALSSVKAIGEDSSDQTAIDDQVPENPTDSYGQSKYEADQMLRKMLLKSSIGWTVLRPSLVYGPGVQGNFIKLLDACARRQLLPVGGIRNQRSMIFVGNLVDALCVSIECPDPLNDTFLIDDNAPVSTPELIRGISRALEVSPRIISVPSWVLRSALTFLGKKSVAERLMGSLVVDSRRFQRVADWTPPYKMVQGLAETAAWYKSRYDL